jgi:hypothetical protein
VGFEDGFFRRDAQDMGQEGADHHDPDAEPVPEPERETNLRDQHARIAGVASKPILPGGDHSAPFAKPGRCG